MRLRSDLLLLPLDEDVVVFSQEAQCLVGLNASAAAMVQRLHSGVPASEIARDLASEGSVPPAEAQRWVQTVLEAMDSHDMMAGAPCRVPASIDSEEGPDLVKRLADMPPYSPFEPASVRHYRLLNVCAEVRFGHLRQVPWVDSVIGHLAAEHPCEPTVTIDIPAQQAPTSVRSFVYCNRESVDYASGLFRLAPIVKGALWQAAVNAHDFSFYVHAGVVGTGNSCILLPAAAGSGKSSLTAALTHRGFRYFSDEVALLESGTLMVPPAPLAFCVKRTGWKIIGRYFPLIADVPIHQRMDYQVVRYLTPASCGVDVAQKSAPVSHIIFPRYVRDCQTELAPVARSEALRRLMVECLALRQYLTPANVQELVRWISNIACYTLNFSALDEAAGLIEAAISSSPQDKVAV